MIKLLELMILEDQCRQLWLVVDRIVVQNDEDFLIDWQILFKPPFMKAKENVL